MKKKNSDSDPLDFFDDSPEVKKTLLQDEKDNDYHKDKSININVEESSIGFGTISFDGEMSINNAKKIKSALCSCVEEYSEINIELSRVGKIDTAGLQLLLSTLKEMNQKNNILKFIKPSKEIKKIFDLFGEGQLLKEMIK